jgi:hypothetical protein
MKPVLVFDIETIPDVEGLRRLHALDPALSDDEVAELAFQHRRAASGHDFLPLHLQRVAVISCVLRRRQGFSGLVAGRARAGRRRDHSTLLRWRRQVYAADGVLERRWI